MAFLGDGSDALHLSFYLDFASRKWSAEDFRDSVGWLEEHIPRRRVALLLPQQPRPDAHLRRLGGGADADARAKVAAAMLITLRGTPIIYDGEEIGMPIAQGAPEADGRPARAEVLAAPGGQRRLPHPDAVERGENAGFTPGEPWLPVDPSTRTRNVERQTADPGSLLTWYRRLIRLRARRPALHSGDYRVIDDAPRGVYAYVRQWENEKLAVVLNFTSRAVTLPERLDGSAVGVWTTLLSSHDAEPEPARGGGRRLRPHEVLILEAGG